MWESQVQTAWPFLFGVIQSFPPIMNRLGKEGWELVTRDDDQGYYFKRSLDEKEQSPELPRS